MTGIWSDKRLLSFLCLRAADGRAGDEANTWRIR